MTTFYLDRRPLEPARVAPPGRVFLPRAEATYRLGLMDAAHRAEPEGVRVACSDRETGEVFEAEGGEVLHAQIAIRVGRTGGPLEDGWTIPAERVPDCDGDPRCKTHRGGAYGMTSKQECRQ
jgi:hypothetical protein